MQIIEDRPFFPWGCKLYPSGEFVLWRKRRETKRKQEESVCAAGFWLLGGRDLGQVLQVFGPSFVYRWWYTAARVALPDVQPGAAQTIISSLETEVDGAAAPMGLSALANSQKRQRGLGGLTTHGRNMVREGAGGLQLRYGKEQLSFWTCTIPPMDMDDWRVVCEGWSEILRQLKLKLQYHLREAGLPVHVVGVTEMQTERYQQEGVPAWHIHWVFVGRKRRKGWALTPETLDKLWQECLENVLERPVWCGSACRIESIRKSAGGYLAKYMSKGTAIAPVVEDWGASFVPSSWYVCTRALGQWVKKCTLRSEDVARWLHQMLLDDIDSVIAPWAFKLETRPGCEIAACWLGRIAHPPDPRLKLG